MDIEINPLSLPPHELEQLRREAREALANARARENPAREKPSAVPAATPPEDTPRPPSAVLKEEKEVFAMQQGGAGTTLTQKNTPPPQNLPYLPSATGETSVERAPNLLFAERGKQTSGEAPRDARVRALEEEVRERARSKAEKAPAVGGERISVPAAPDSPRNASTPESPEREAIAIKTMRGDVVRAVETQKLSLSQIALLERQKRTNEKIEIELRERGQGQRIVIGASIIFILAATGVISYLAFFGTALPTTDTTLPGKISRESIVHADLERAVDIAGLSGSDVRAKMREIVLNTTVAPGKVTSVLLANGREGVQAELGAADFTSALSLAAPSGFSKSLDISFMFGIYGSGGANHGFLIFKSRSYETSFDALLSWEPRMAEDLLAALGADIGYAAGATWQDAVIKTIFSRALISQSGRINLMYAFLDKRTIVITADKDTFVEVLGRYTTPKDVIR